MSTKTIKQRIAVVAVSALTAGLFSVVTAPASNAGPNVAAGTVQTGAALEGTLNIATLASTTGSAVTTTTNTTNASSGLVNVSSVLGDLTAGTTQTAVLLNTGSLVVYSATTTANSASAVTVSGGTLSGAITASASAAAMNGSRTVYAVQGDAGGTADTFAVAVTPDAGATSMTVTLYTFPATTTAATASAAPTLGTVAGLITVTITTSSVAGAMSTARSGVFYSSAGGAETLTEDAASGTWLTRSPTTQFANVRVRDAFLTPISSTTGLLQATATNGALVALNASGTTTAGTASTAFRTGASPDGSTLVVRAPSFAPLTTTVTVTWNGVVIGTKNFTFTGPISRVTLGSALRIGQLNQAATATVKGATISFADSAGNAIFPVAGSAFYPTTSVTAAATSDRAPIMSITPTSSVTGHIDWNCAAATASTDNAIMIYTNINGVVATSNAASVSCAGDAVSYAASYDKATYLPGDVATLTVTFKDSKGNVANDTFDWSTGSFGAASVTTGGGLLAVASSAADTSALGKATYRVLVGSNEGTFNTVVNVDALTGQSAVIAPLVVKASSTTVTNAEVLKSIVSLIASINKQIQALQKLILRR
jgi:hypothetical protein